MHLGSPYSETGLPSHGDQAILLYLRLWEAIFDIAHPGSILHFVRYTRTVSAWQWSDQPLACLAPSIFIMWWNCTFVALTTWLPNFQHSPHFHHLWYERTGFVGRRWLGPGPSAWFNDQLANPNSLPYEWPNIVCFWIIRVSQTRLTIISWLAWFRPAWVQISLKQVSNWTQTHNMCWKSVSARSMTRERGMRRLKHSRRFRQHCPLQHH